MTVFLNSVIIIFTLFLYKINRIIEHFANVKVRFLLATPKSDNTNLAEL